MNDLNSVLIEGIAHGKPTGQIFEDEPKDNYCYFYIDVKREHFSIGAQIWVTGRLVENTMDKVKKGSPLRIVGHLGEFNGGDLHIEAEHIELRKARAPIET